MATTEQPPGEAGESRRVLTLERAPEHSLVRLAGWLG
jgi:hypothetical protein